MKCHCCSGINFEDCCHPFLAGIKLASTAEALMRSRYTAYVVVDVNYIIATTHRSTRNLYNTNSIKQWAESSTWQKLEIVSIRAGTANDSNGKVEFKAYYLDSIMKGNVHHEYSDFVKENDTWFFVGGTIA